MYSFCLSYAAGYSFSSFLADVGSVPGVRRSVEDLDNGVPDRPQLPQGLGGQVLVGLRVLTTEHSQFEDTAVLNGKGEL